MKNIAIIIALTLAGCAIPAPERSEVDGNIVDMSTVSSIDQDVVTPETVCGVPQRCAPWSCWTDGFTVTCEQGGQSDLQCQVACGTDEAQCPLIWPATACHNKCDPFGVGPAWAYCFQQCVNGFTTSCQLGRGDL